MSGRLARAYLRTGYARAGLIERLNVLFEGFWLGALDDRSLVELDEHYYRQLEQLPDRVARYTDAGYNESGLFAWEAAVVERYFSAGCRVLVTGAGAGREVIALLDRGFDAVGYEPNAELVAAGDALLRGRGTPDRLHVMPRDGLPEATGTADAFVVGWGSYMHVRGRAQRVAFLQAARRRLPDGAPVLLSFFVRPDGAYHHVAVARVAGVVRRCLGREPVDVGDALELHYVHRFDRADVDSELQAAGFRLEHFAASPYGHAVGVAT